MIKYNIILSVLIISVLMSAECAIAQQGKGLKRGRVWNTEKKPVRGAVVGSAVTGFRTQTDDKGFFEMLTVESDTLTISHVGYETKTVTSLLPTELLNIVLTTRDNVIEEIEINTGYQTLKPNEITGSIQVIDKEVLNEQMGVNILDRLRNVSSGLLFDNVNLEDNNRQKHNFTVRGLSTINGPIDPLIVLDGFIYEGNIENIDPNNVESISILKDAAATSIWGARAGNGVVVITSKKGSVRNGMQISFQQSLLTGQKSDYSNLYEMGVSDYIAIEEMLFRNGYYNNQLNRNPERAVTPMISILNKRQKGLITADDSIRMVNSLLANSSKKAYQEHFLQTPALTQSFLGVARTTDNMRSNLGIGYTNNHGENKDRSRKLNLHFNNSLQLSEKLQVDVNLQFTNQNTYSGTPGFRSFTHGSKSVPYTAFTDQHGTPVPFDLSYDREFMASYYPEHLMSWEYVPLEDYKHSVSNTDLTEWYTVANVGYRPFKFLNLSSGLQIQAQNLNSYADHSIDSYYTRILINQFTEIDHDQNTVRYNIPKGGVRKEDRNTVSSYTWRNQLDFTRTWTDFDVKSILGAEIRQNKAQASGMQVYGYNSDPLRTVPVDYSKPYATLPTGASYSILGSPTYSQTLNRFVSLYLNGSLIYKRKYGFYASLRRDGANIFGAKTNDQWVPFWSAGGSWELSQEDFYRSEFMPYLKLRATYGYSGNVDLRKTPLPIASSFSASLTNFPTLIINSMNDPTLRWEKVRTYNIGVDFKFGRDIVTGTIEYYEKRGTDLYGAAPYDYTVWGRSSTITKNIAEMVGRGIEARILAQPVKTGAFSWQPEVLINFNKNKTTAYHQRNFTGLISFVGAGNAIVPIVGKPLNAIAAWRWAGLDAEGNPQGFLAGQPSTDYLGIRAEAAELDEEATNLYFVGSSVPQAYGSLINTIRYKDFRLSFNFSFKGDYYFMRPVTSYATLYTMGQAQRDFDDRWQKKGDELQTNVPAVNYPLNRDRDGFYAGSEINVLRGDHIRLEYVNIGWNTSLRFGQRNFNTVLNMNLSNLGVVWRKNRFVSDPAHPESIVPGKRIGLSLKIEL